MVEILKNGLFRVQQHKPRRKLHDPILHIMSRRARSVSRSPVGQPSASVSQYRPMVLYIIHWVETTPLPMTAVLKTSLVVVCLQVLGFSVAHLGPISRRRTMGFGPVHPHDEF